MKIFAVLCSIAVLACGAAAAEVKRVEISSTDVATLVGKRAEDLSVFGFHLGMARPEAEGLLAQSKKFIAVTSDDEYLRDTVYVFARSASGGQTGKTLLSLDWAVWPEGADMPQTTPDLKVISIFEDARPLLKPNFRRLLTADATEEKSPFRKRFLGAPSSTKESPAMGTLGKSTAYFYREIGINVSVDHATGRRGFALSHLPE